MIYLFDCFELSDEEFSLSRDGRRLAIEPRALRVLLVLVGSQGRLQDKKALLEAVWKDTYVEETTLTRAVAVIRKHLEDDPRAPKYIETIPTRGYRFIAPVEVRQTQCLAPEPSTPAQGTVEVIEANIPKHSQNSLKATTTTALIPSRARLKRSISIYVATAFVFLAAGLAAFLLYRKHQVPALTTKDTIVLADFINATDDHVFDDALRQGLLVQLEQSPVLRLASDAQIRTTLRLMGLQTSASLSSEVGGEVCQRIGGTVLLNGSISRLGNEYVIGLQAKRCATGEVLATEQIQIAKKEDALNALSQIATRFRSRIGEASATLHDLDVPLAEATTSSLDALKAFSRGMSVFNSKGSAAAVALFQQATELDPDFAEAHVWLGRMYADLGQNASAVQSTQKAYALRTRASYRERLSIDVSYDLIVTGDLEKARAACEAWIQMYPRDVYPRAFLAGMIYPAYGQYEKALNEAKDSMAIDPDFVVGYRNAAVSLIALNRVSEAEQVLQLASERKLFLPGFVSTAYRMAFLKGDAEGMKRATDTAPTNPWLVQYRAATLALAGRMSEARALENQATSLPRRTSKQELEAELTATGAMIDALYDYREAAAKGARAALRLSTGKNVSYLSALVLSMTQNTEEAQKVVSDLLQRFPEDTLVRNQSVPTIQAEISLMHHQPQQAIDLLQPTSQFEVSLPLHAVYLRGLGLLATGRSSQAIAEFKKITDRPGLVLNDPLLNLAELNLARAYVAAGELKQANATYLTLLQRLSSADRDLPILLQARREQTAL